MSNTRSLIEQFYLEEKERLAAESAFSPVEISITSADMAIINTIAKRFNKDKSMLMREVLSQALIDMFSAIEPAERKMLAKEADELAQSIATDIAEEQGLAEVIVNGTNWVQQDKSCVKAERKAEKEKAEKLKAEPVNKEPQAKPAEDTPSKQEAIVEEKMAEEKAAEVTDEMQIEDKKDLPAEPADSEMGSRSIFA